MKITRLLLLALASFALGATAYADRAPHVVPFSNGDELVVSKVVNPSNLPHTFTRNVLNVRFALDDDGQPQEVRVTTMIDREVKKQVVKAFKQWRFDVSTLNADTASKYYILPLEIIPEQ